MNETSKTILRFFLALIILFGFYKFVTALTNAFSDDTESSETSTSSQVIDAAQDNKENFADSSTSESVSNKVVWKYETTYDEMRDEKAYFAINESTNTVNLDFPYNGGTQLSIMLRKHPEFGEDVIFAVNKGQLFCTYGDCNVSIKFDSGKVEKYPVNRASGGASEALFLSQDLSEFVSKLKAADKVMIEVYFFNAGAEQFKFETSGLEWSHF